MNKLYLKHKLLMSPVGPAFLKAKDILSVPHRLRHPELALLKEEDALMRAVFARLLKPESNCVDVGVHIGSVSQLFEALAPKGHHMLIEASPTKAAWLRKAFPKGELHQVAVSDSEGEVSFFENIDNPGFSSLGARASRGQISEIKVPCTTLDKLLANRDAVDLIKIDVEGFEYNVVKGAVEALKRLQPAIIFEAGALKDADLDNNSYTALFEMLTTELGYDVFPVFGFHYGRDPITQAEFASCRTYPFLAFNYVAVPQNRAVQK